MERRVEFQKVSYEQFRQDFLDYYPEELDEKYIQNIYDSIKIPCRATEGSAGYDFFIPFAIKLKPTQTIMIPTGIKCDMGENMVLMMFPRSGLGSKFRFILCNTVGVVDSDYINSDNEGHIFMNMVNNGDKELSLEQGKAFCQGVLMNYCTTTEDAVTSKRNGGFGSSDK